MVCVRVVGVSTLVTEVHRVLTVNAVVTDADPVRVHRPYSASDGRTMVPVAVRITVHKSGQADQEVTVEVTGRLVRKDGSVGSMESTTTYYEPYAEWCTAGLPFSEMRGWLADFVAEAVGPS